MRHYPWAHWRQWRRLNTSLDDSVSLAPYQCINHLRISICPCSKLWGNCPKLLTRLPETQTPKSKTCTFLRQQRDQGSTEWRLAYRSRWVVPGWVSPPYGAPQGLESCWWEPLFGWYFPWRMACCSQSPHCTPGLGSEDTVSEQNNLKWKTFLPWDPRSQMEKDRMLMIFTEMFAAPLPKAAAAWMFLVQPRRRLMGTPKQANRQPSIPRSDVKAEAGRRLGESRWPGLI